PVLVSPTSLTFGKQSVGTTSVAQNILLANNQNVMLIVSGITITGTNAADFADSATCGGSIGGYSSCMISVSFTPKAKGTRHATLTISDGPDKAAPHNVTLTGTGS